MTNSMISVPTAGTSFAGYLALPDSKKGPGVVVIQEMFGLNPFVRHICDTLAESGYIALGPDLYWRQQTGLHNLTDRSESDVNQAFSLLEAFDIDAGIMDLQTSINYLRDLDGCTGPVGGVGYCLGGLLAYLLTARTDAECAVGYYAVGINQRLGEANSITHPLMLHVADADRTMPPSEIANFTSVLAHYTHITIHRYPGLDHGFARLGTKYFTYSKEATQLADTRTLDFLAKNLN